MFIRLSKVAFRLYSEFSAQAFDIITFKNPTTGTRFKMARGMPSCEIVVAPPKLHDDVARLLGDEGLQKDFLDADDEETNIEEWETNVMGPIYMPKQWMSLQRLVKQKSCDHHPQVPPTAIQCTRVSPAMQKLQSSWLASPVSRVLRGKSDILAQKWNGIEVQRPSSSGHSRGPYDSELANATAS